VQAVSTNALTPEFVRHLWEAHETYRHLVEGIPAILYVDAVDDSSTALYTSPQIEPILGITAEEWQANPALWLNRMHEDDRERVVAEHLESNRTGKPFRCVYRMFAADGREVWIRDEAVLVLDAEDRPRFWRGIMFDVTEQMLAEERLRESLEERHRTAEERRRLLQRVEEAQEEERRRIAADIHDDSIQVMTALALQAQGIATQLPEGDLRREAEALRDAVSEAVEHLRRIVFELRPPVVERGGLATALRAYADRFPDVDLVVEDELDADPPSETRFLVFQIAQEALANARKHASARGIVVTVRSEDQGIRLRVADDGAGFDVAVVDDPEPGHIGLLTMIERAERAGGRLRIDSIRGRGTTIDAWVPAPPAGGRRLA
jgi:PAS domain S-box-containing protein